MTAWSIALGATLPTLLVPLGFALRGTVATRLAALQLGTALVTVLLILMSFAFGQDSYTSLAIGLSLMSAVGSLVTALALERWL